MLNWNREVLGWITLLHFPAVKLNNYACLVWLYSIFLLARQKLIDEKIIVSIGQNGWLSLRLAEKSQSAMVPAWVCQPVWVVIVNSKPYLNFDFNKQFSNGDHLKTWLNSPNGGLKLNIKCISYAKPNSRGILRNEQNVNYSRAKCIRGRRSLYAKRQCENKVTCKRYPAIARTGTSESEVQRINWTSIVFGGRGGEIIFFIVNYQHLLSPN